MNMRMSNEQMFGALWSFLQLSPQGSVPFPWERCYNIVSNMLYYKNVIDGTLMVDLRNVDIGDSLYHDSSLWNTITELADLKCTNHRYYRHLLAESEMTGPIVMRASCCGSHLYLVMPEKIFSCPICDAFISYQDYPTA